MVDAGATVAVDVVLGSGKLVLRGKRSEEATDFDNGIRWDVTNAAGETVTTYGGEVTIDLAAGDYTVKASLGEATAEVPVSVPAGKTVETVGRGRDRQGHRPCLLRRRRPGGDGRPALRRARSRARHRRPARVHRHQLRGRRDLRPAAGQVRDAGLVRCRDRRRGLRGQGRPADRGDASILDAGILAVTAPGGDFLELLSAKKDIYGKQQSVAYTYGESWQVTAPAGDYVLKVRKTDGSETETPATVKAGERTEVTAN